MPFLETKYFQCTYATAAQISQKYTPCINLSKQKKRHIIVHTRTKKPLDTRHSNLRWQFRRLYRKFQCVKLNRTVVQLPIREISVLHVKKVSTTTNVDAGTTDEKTIGFRPVRTTRSSSISPIRGPSVVFRTNQPPRQALSRYIYIKETPI